MGNSQSLTADPLADKNLLKTYLALPPRRMEHLLVPKKVSKGCPHTEDTINCLLLSTPERERGHWSQAWGTSPRPPSFCISSLWPDAGPGSQFLLHFLVPFRGPKEETSYHTWPNLLSFLLGAQLAPAGVRVGGSQQRFPGIMAVIGQHKIRLPYVCPPKVREEVQLLERQGYRRAHVGEGSCPPTPEGNLLAGQFVPPFLIMLPIFSVW